MSIIIKETGLIVPNANSYADLNDASDYFSGHLYHVVFTSKDEPTREKALIMATKLLDNCMLWWGQKVDPNQALDWPRRNIRIKEFADIHVPKKIVEATCELTRFILEEDITRNLNAYATVDVDVLRSSINLAGITTLPKYVLEMVSLFGIPKAGATAWTKVTRF